jgi:hypothetical protein
MLGLVDSNQFTPSLPLTPRSVSNLTSGREHAIAQGNNCTRGHGKSNYRTSRLHCVLPASQDLMAGEFSSSAIEFK